MEINNLDIKVLRIHRIENSKTLKAFVDICVNETLIIKGLSIMDGKNGLFVSMPKERSKDNKWYERVSCLSKEVHAYICEEIMTTYKAEMIVSGN